MRLSAFVSRAKDPRTVALAIVLAFISVAYFFRGKDLPPPTHQTLFTDTYPASLNFVEELKALRREQKLTQKNESAISDSVKSVATALEMPPAILWCLMFQESRLDHLLGIEGERPIYGLGQFSHFSFFEINHQLNRYSDSNLLAMKQLLGRDVRPIGPIARPLNNPSSYYNIPTAVVSTGSFLHNRYLQLARVLRWQGIDPDPQLLWLYATMAYNKGTRTVLSLWNEIRREQGVDAVRASVVDPVVFNLVADNAQLANHALKRIWPADRAKWYSNELILHIHQIRQCALEHPSEPSEREITDEK